MRARLAAQTRWAQTADRTAATQAARDALAAKWEEADDPDAARKAHMTRMAYLSSVARRSA